jgi:hypothetical protein
MHDYLGVLVLSHYFLKLIFLSTQSNSDLPLAPWLSVDHSLFLSFRIPINIWDWVHIMWIEVFKDECLLYPHV